MLQKSVGLYPAIGIPGQQVAFNQAVYTPQNYLSDGTVQCGGFAFAVAASTTGTAVKFPIASLKGSAGANRSVLLSARSRRPSSWAQILRTFIRKDLN